MAYTDQQIANYAHQLEAKGASANEIETFVKAAKQEQGLTKSADMGGEIAKNVFGAFNPSKLIPNAVNAVKTGAEAAQKLGGKLTVAPGQSEATNKSVQELNSVGIVPNSSEADIKGQVQTLHDVQALPDVIKYANPGQWGETPLVKNVSKEIVGGAGDILSGAGDVVAGNAKMAGAVTGMYQPTVEDSEQAIKGLTKMATGFGRGLSSPITGAVESLPESFDTKAHAQQLMSLPNTALVGIFKQIRPDLDEKYIQENIVNPIWGAASVEGGLKMAGDKGVSGRLSDAAKKTIDNVKSKLSPSDPEALIDKTTGQIVQGDLNDIKPAKKALSEIDTKNVKTYKDLKKVLNKEVKNKISMVDDELNKSTTKYKLSNFDEETTVGNTTVKTNPVKLAIDQLEELYTKTNSPKDLARIVDLKNRAGKYTLTLKEINDLAREYGGEFGKKAFDKKGDPLTSVNAQAYENTRSSLKEAVRKELPTETVKALDGDMHNLIKTKDLVSKMEKKVNNLAQKVQERGLLERAAGATAETIDVVTGHILRGFISKLVPKNVGLKTLNSLDLEKSLAKNLQLLDKLNAQLDSSPQSFITEVKQHPNLLPLLGAGAKETN